jgi:ribA/ribD-fused uncharacterized protein
VPLVEETRPPLDFGNNENENETNEEKKEDENEDTSNEESNTATEAPVEEVKETAVATVGGGETIHFSSKSPTFKEFSNFHKAKFLLDGKEWPTVEHYFQAQKFQTSPEYQEKIRSASEASKAKTLGSSKEYPIRNDWDTYREEVMKKALNAKFQQNLPLRDLLLSTKNSPLVEATTDPYWGEGRNKKGKNRLGLLLMELRDTFDAGK